MNELSNYINCHLYSFINLFFLFQLFNLVFPQILNNIIILGENNLRYSHINFNKNGDMIIDISAFPVTTERKFFGLKKNGRFYFKDSNNKETAYYSMTADHTRGRIEGESYIIKLTSNNNNLHGKEMIYGISKNERGNPNFYTEVYNLDNKNMTKYLTINIFGNIVSNTFNIIEKPNQLNSNYYYYTLSYIVYNSSSYYLNIIDAYFSFDISTGSKHVIEISTKVKVQRIVSCFYTDKSLYICFFLSEENQIIIKVYDSDFSSSKTTSFYDPTINFGALEIFFKGIHLKGEIGFFIYFKEGKNYPTFSVLQCNNDKTMTAYSNFEEINIDKYTFHSHHLLNDIIKLNNFQICYTSISEDKLNFQIVIITLYKSDTLMNIRYYQIEIWITYTKKIYLDIKSGLYKNFVSLAFSHCSQNNCESPYSDAHIVSLIIFSYPNSTDNSLDIIPQLYYTNKKIENDFSFNFDGALTIENNLFGLVFKGTRIMNYPEGLSLVNITNRKILKIESIISKDENVSLYFDTHENYAKNDYIIEYAYVLEEPNYDEIKNYYNDTDYTYGENIESEKNYYQKYEYTGRSSYFTIQISENLITDCNDDYSCELCFPNYTCITCTYGYTFNNSNKICVPKPFDECCIEEILKGKCTNKKITTEQIKEVYQILNQRISEDSNELIETKNAIFQMTTLEFQKYLNNSNVSSIDLGECEDIIKIEKGLSENDNLLILKLDIKNDDLSSTYVQYAIYDPRTLDLISLDLCVASNIIINIPKTLDQNTRSIYISLNQSGYNLFDLNDSFYKDICSTYTTENGTDLILSDRKNIIYDNSGQISMCQNGCTFQYFNLTTNKSQCYCFVQTEEVITNISNTQLTANKLFESFYKSLKNSNFMVLKCFKLVFSKQGIKNNIGSYVMTLFNFIFISLLFIYIIKDNKTINFFIQEILKKVSNRKKNENKIIKVPKKNLKKKENIKKVNNYPPKKSSNINPINNVKIKNSMINLMVFPNKRKEELNNKNSPFKSKEIFRYNSTTKKKDSKT